MEQIGIFSARVRWLAIATGVASALALFPILALLYPALLIVGGIIQPRSPSAGRWLVWAGAAELWVILITYDVFVIFPHPLSQPFLMTSTFSLATVLLLWCSGELIADGLNRVRARRSSPRARPSPVGWAAWAVAAVLNFLTVWSAHGIISWHRHPDTPGLPDNGFYSFGFLLVTGVIVIAFDISLITRVAQMRRARAAGISRECS
jgi:hypothetical protein